MLIVDKFFNRKIKNIDVLKDKLDNFNYHEDSVKTIALIYLRRYLKCEDISSRNLEETVRACISLANKFLLDCNIIDNNKMELEIIKKLNWDLFVSEQEFYSCSSSMTSRSSSSFSESM